MRKTTLALALTTVLGALFAGPVMAAPVSPAAIQADSGIVTQVQMSRGERMMMRNRMMKKKMMRQRMMKRRMNRM